MAGPGDAGKDRTGADHVAGLEILEHEHEVPLPRIASLLAEALATADDLRRR